MGKKYKKRKRTKLNLSDQSGSGSGENSSSNQSFVGSIISAASQVLYGTPVRPSTSNTHDLGPGTSTPMSAAPSEGVVMATLVEQSEQLKCIMQRLSKLDKIDTIEQKLTDMNLQMSRFEGRIQEIEQKTKQNSEKLDSVKVKVEEIENKNTDLDACMNQMKRYENTITLLQRQMDTMRRDKREIEARVPQHEDEPDI
ncbi:hypothetical protein FSP39_004385 [Pinctada imbricata]|uniref:Uncharacterized protein n=1 Tax=Pinctada imbricata TaxID=66713 RepID=A0AA89C6K3_PINIB|nr:hypothetical protein FSP39_004385 [Pinctada imbricata]